MTQAASDWDQLLPALEQIDQRLEQKPKQIVADAGYTTRAVIEEMAERKLDFLGSMPREDASSGRMAPNRLPPNVFVYQPETDRYLCPSDKFLRYEGRIKNERGLVSYRYEARREDCNQCARKPECCPENQKRGRGLLRNEESAAVLAFSVGRWPPSQRRKTIAAEEEWLNSATLGSKASWGCGSFMCAAW